MKNNLYYMFLSSMLLCFIMLLFVGTHYPNSIRLQMALLVLTMCFAFLGVISLGIKEW